MKTNTQTKYPAAVFALQAADSDGATKSTVQTMLSRAFHALQQFARVTTKRAWFIQMLAVLLIGNAFTESATAGDPYGTSVAVYNGVPIYSNGSASYVSNQYNSMLDSQGQSYRTGMKWQCVEYANRYYLMVYGKKIRVPGTNGCDYYGTASQRGLTAYPNGGTTPPQPGDILCFGGGPSALGHVSIARERQTNAVIAAQQNVKCTSADANFYHALTVNNGRYTLSASSLGSNFWCQGWLRATGGNTQQKSQITSPANGSTLPGSQASFSWSSVSGAREYSLALGSTLGGSNYWSGSMGMSTSVTFTGLPTDGSMLYVRLGTRFDSGWQYSDSSYRAAGNRPTDYRATMISPQAGSVLPGSSVSFYWTTGSGALEYFLYLGNYQGANDLWGGSLGLSTNVSFTGMPTDGRAIWVRLWTRTASGWLYGDYQYWAARW